VASAGGILSNVKDRRQLGSLRPTRPARVLGNRVLTKTTNTRFCQNTLSWLCGNSVLSIPVLVVAPKQDIRLLGG
jgi:hypothetical protein